MVCGGMGRNRKWIKTNTADFDEVTLIGSGGNINKIVVWKDTRKPYPTFI
jgi:glutaredoxin-related protein